MSKLAKGKIVLAVCTFLTINIFYVFIGGPGLKMVHAQHIDVFNLDKDQLPKKVKPDTPEMEWVVVEDRVRYKVAVEKSKYDSKDLKMEDIELWEIVDKSPFEWHQVDYYLESEIKEINTRTFGKQKCERFRKGTLFWLKDGKKAVFWTRWSVWDCRPEEERD
ncbi:MAG: hypothetical protein JYX80_12865 [Candidatus Scalindua sediminis]|nr:hypothetical protein [Candidatus Scalindua sediminis]